MVWEGESLVLQERFISRLRKVFIFVVLCIITIALRFFYLQVIRGDYFYKISEQNRTQLFRELAPRGILYDTKGNVLCKNSPTVTVLFYPFLIKKDTIVFDELLKRLKKIIPDAKQKILEGYKSKKTVCLARNISRETMFKLLEQKIDLQGVSVVNEMARYYPYGRILSHLIGYIGEIDSEELKELQYLGYKQGDIIGKAGIEKQFDMYIRGSDGGWLIESDALGKQLNIAQRILPVPGKDIFLTIDIELQKVAEECLKQAGLSGAIVGLDPKDGAVRILASSPSFDPNLFVYGTPERLRYFSDNSLPMFNRAIQGEYAPGSVFKIITSIAALDKKKVTTEDKFYCPGYFTLGRKTFRCWEEKGHKNMDFHSGMVNSCDVYFYNVGLKTGIENIVTYAEKFNLGKALGISLPSEKSGFLPTSGWRKSKFKYGWVEGDTVSIAIGQGYLTVTPIQMASLISTVANKGKVYRPYIVSRIVSKDGTVVYEHKPEKLSVVEIQEKIWLELENALIDVVELGTGRAARVHGLTLAGKTGTAENPHGKDHAWFVAYGPAENPELALSVFIEHGGKGGAVAAPVAQKIFSKLKQTLEISKLK